MTLDNDKNERQERIARLEKELNALKRGSQGGTEAGPSGLKQIELDAASNHQQVKKEKGPKDKGKGKEKEVLVLSDSD